MGEKVMKILGPANNIATLVKGANEKEIKKEDIVEILSIPNGYMLIYFG